MESNAVRLPSCYAVMLHRHWAQYMFRRRNVYILKFGSLKYTYLLSLRVELKTSRLLNGCSNQLSYESFLKMFIIRVYLNLVP